MKANPFNLKTKWPRGARLAAGLALGLVACLSSLVAAAPEPAAAAVSNAPAAAPAVPYEFTFPKSVFVDDQNIGKDPFFPTSTRRVRSMDMPSLTKTNDSGPTPGPKPKPYEEDAYVQLSLKGIVGGGKFALINNQPFAAGESFTLQLKKGPAKVKCIEIRKTSAVLHIETEAKPKELFLPIPVRTEVPIR